MGSGRESFLGTVSRTYPVMFVGGLKPIRLRPGRDVLKSAPNSWLCLTLAPELSKPFNFDPMHVEGTPSTRHLALASFVAWTLNRSFVPRTKGRAASVTISVKALARPSEALTRPLNGGLGEGDFNPMLLLDKSYLMSPSDGRWPSISQL